MKYLYLIIILLTLMIGCTTGNMTIHSSDISSIEPLMERTPEEKKVNVAVPVYKF